MSARHVCIGDQWTAPTDQDGTSPTITNLSATNPASIANSIASAGGMAESGVHLPGPGGCRVHLGATVLSVRPISEARVSEIRARRAHRAEAVRIDRPPMVPCAPPGEPVPVPVAGASPSPPRLSIAALVLPVVTGVVLAVIINPMLAIMAATSPILMLGSWVEERRRAARTKSRGLRTVAEQLVVFDSELRTTVDDFQRSCWTRYPGIGAMSSIAESADLRLWERRPGHVDFGQVGIGLGSRMVPHRLARVSGVPAHVTAESLIDQHRQLGHVPVPVDIGPRHTVGVYSSSQQNQARNLARSFIVQAAVMHGPADLRVAVLTDAAHQREWAWAATLPHTSIGCDPLLSCDADTVRSVLDDLDRQPTWTIVVVDGADMREHPLVRALHARDDPWLTTVIVADRIDQIPQHATTTIRVDGLLGVVSRTQLDAAETNDPVVITGVGIARASRIAGALGRCRDGALLEDGSLLPDRVGLGEVLGYDADCDGADAWAHRMTSHWELDDGNLVAVLGVAGGRPVRVDLVTDGPHALIAGTTGAGKSELLRTLVCSLAAAHSPDRLTFVLIDYKGGAAFTGLDALPHTVGFVTDLDAGLGARALTCLEAELRHREHVLAAAGADDIATYPHGEPGMEPLPRLVVIIDEFATMLAELPSFVSALISVAQRGRSLGVHLVLATQRPAGAVNDSIRANTNLRLCLRVQTPADSSDVIGSAAAATLDRRFPGRAVLRTGPDEFVTMQSASCTLSPAQLHPRGSTTDSQRVFRAPDRSDGGVVTTDPRDRAATPAGGDTDLRRIVDASVRTAQALGLRPARRPWPEPLPDQIALIAHDGEITVGMVDLPEQQRTEPIDVELCRANTVLFGAAGSGASEALRSIVAALATSAAPEALHLYLVDYGAGGLGGLDDLPHVGARITPNEPDRLERLARMLLSTIDARRSVSTTPDAVTTENPAGLTATGPAHGPNLVICIDDWSAVRAASDDSLGTGMERWYRIFAEGPAVGVTTVLTADRAQAMPGAALSSFPTRFAFRLNDPIDDAILGIARSAPSRDQAGRALHLATGSLMQFADGDVATLMAHPHIGGRLASADRLARPIETLPTLVGAHTIWDMAAEHPTRTLQTVGGLHVPVGIGDNELGLVGWDLQQGEHVLVTGPARSGKSNVLAVIAAAARASRPGIGVVTLTGRGSTLGSVLRASGIDHQHLLSVTDLGANLTDAPTMILIDDAEFVDDPTGDLARLIATRTPELWIAATGRADVLRTAYGHWTAAIRRSRKGLALRPHLEQDGELWATPLPRRQVPGGTRSMPSGRGFLVDDGHVELVQTGMMPVSEISPIESGSQGSPGRRIAS